MKHPSSKVLQDYFENEVNDVQSALVQEHLLECDVCSQTLSEMAKLDTRVKAMSKVGLSDNKKNEIFAAASVLLKQKRDRISEKEEKINKKNEMIEDWKRAIVEEFKIPALQVASLSILLTFITVSSLPDDQESDIKLIDNEVAVFSYQELPLNE